MNKDLSTTITKALAGMPKFRGELGRLFMKLGLCAGVIVLIHLMPKERSPENTMRFYMTIAYFATLAAFAYNLLSKRQKTVITFLKERYQTYPEQTQSAAMRLGISFNSLIDLGLHLAMVLVVSLAVLVLGNASQPWIDGLGFLLPLATGSYYLSLAGLLLFPLVKANALQEAAQLYRMVTRDTERFDELAENVKRPLSGGEALAVKGPGHFVAGQVEWHWELLRRNSLVLGETGSGKTLCVLNAMLEGTLASWNNSREERCSALILDPKGDFRDKVAALCSKLGRSDDLVIVDPFDLDRSAIWNPLDSDDDALELASRFAAVMEAKDSEHGKGEAFWIDSARKLIRHSIALLRLTNPPGVPPSFEQINRLANSNLAVQEHLKLLDVSDPECEQCLDFFETWVPLVAETKQAVQAHVSNMIDPFLMNPYRKAFSGKSTIRMPDAIEQGKIIYIYMPAADKVAMARTICTFAKLEFQREVKKRPGKRRPSLFFCDEFQLFFTTIAGQGDSDFFEISRGSNHANIIATQNLQALFKYAPEKKETVKNLIGNCAVKICLRNTEEETNEFASKLFGEHLVTSGVSGTSAGGGGGKLGGLVGGGSISIQQNEQRERIVRPERFARLISPSQTHGVNHSTTIIHISGSPEERVDPRFEYQWRVHLL